jgi:crotonobetainyl-CoA:carnitine CoA-transferase CaiB-like acyl-CoA transferase
VAALLHTISRDEWYDLLTKADVCVGKVYDPHEVFEDPQIRHGEMALQLDVNGTSALNPGTAIMLLYGGAFPDAVARRPHHEILASLGYALRDIEALRAAGAV